MTFPVDFALNIKERFARVSEGEVDDDGELSIVCC